MDRNSFALLCALLCTAGCTTGAAPCTPGASLPCACTDGRSGAQLCGPDERLNACVCAGGDAGLDAASDAGVTLDMAIDASDAATGGDAGDAGLDAASDAATTPFAVFTIVLSNFGYDELVGSANAPYLNTLIARYGLATMYTDVGEPGLPNRLDLVSGDPQYPGFIDVDPTAAPTFPVTATHLGSQFEAAGISWRAYAEGMPTPCGLAGSGVYAPKHDPFLYFHDIQSMPALCADRNVDTSSLAGDLAAGTVRYFWIAPDSDHDGTNPIPDRAAAATNADMWLQMEVPQILVSPGWLAGGVLFITVDHAADGSAHVPMLVISPRLGSALTSTTPYTHDSYLATVEDLFGLSRLGHAATATPLSALLP